MFEIFPWHVILCDKDGNFIFIGGPLEGDLKYKQR